MRYVVSLFFVIFFMPFVLSDTSQLYGPSLISPSPANTVIAFDLHGVVLTTNYQQIFQYIRHSLHKWELFKILPSAAVRLAKFIKRPRVYELFFDYLFEGSVQKDVLMEDFITMTNMQKIDHEMVNTIKDLKNAGYPVVLASNIGEKTYNALLQQSPEMAAVLNLFDYHIIPRPINDYAHKPEARYYSMLQANYPDKHIVLIDDSKSKVCAAARNGMSGIRFTSVQKLQQILHDLNFY